ncbi:hypothetical protein ACWEKT_38435 [Nocardia takedensis]
MVDVDDACDPGPMPASSHGHQVEDRARQGAAILGVPDFVYEPEHLTRGEGSREVGDGLLVAGQAGLILQSKSRQLEKAVQDTPGKAESWCRKNGLVAQRQANGTRRAIRRGGVSATSLRGYRRSLPTSANWYAVVIIDHPTAPSFELAASKDTLFIALNDWLLLQYRVRSTAGIIQYIERAVDSSLCVPLGEEMVRFAALADADLKECTVPSSFPTLSLLDLSDEDQFCVALVDELVDHVADSANRGFHPEEYLTIVEQLDRIPIIGRTRLGSKMKRTVLDVAADGKRRSFIMTDGGLGSCLSGNRLAFIYQRFNFLADGIEGHYFNAEVAAYGMTRQLQALRHGASTDTGTLVIGVLIHRQLGPRYTFFFVSGTPSIPDEIAAHFAAKYGTFDGQSIQ